MKTLITLLLTITTTVATAQANKQNLGPIAGGGGKVVVCYKDKSKEFIEDVTLLDFWEGNKRKPKYTYSDQFLNLMNEDDLLDLVIKRVSHLLDGSTTSALHNNDIQKAIWNEIKDYDREKDEMLDVQLDITKDSYESFKPVPPCYIEQMVDYHQTDGPMVNQKYYKWINGRKHAALRFHEGFYAFLRKLDRTNNSLSTRRIVARAFSDQYLLPDLQNKTMTPIAQPTFLGLESEAGKFVAENVVKCLAREDDRDSTNTIFFLYKRKINNVETLVAQFSKLNNREMLSLSYLDMETGKFNSDFQFDNQVRILSYSDERYQTYRGETPSIISVIRAGQTEELKLKVSCFKY